MAWSVNPERAQGVEYVFGVVQGRVQSAYKVSAPVRDWPEIPKGALGGGRRCIPVVSVSPEDWAAATTWSDVAMFGAVHCGDVRLTGGHFDGYSFPESDASGEELVLTADE